MSKQNKTVNVSGYINADRKLVDTVQNRILALLDRKNGEWAGTMTQLAKIVTRRSTPENFPKSASIFRRLVNVTLPKLRNAGVSVRFERDSSHSRTRLVHFTR